MKPDNLDGRSRIFIEANRDGQSVTWKRHPSAKGNFEQSVGDAIEVALGEIDFAPAVIIWSGR